MRSRHFGRRLSWGEASVRVQMPTSGHKQPEVGHPTIGCLLRADSSFRPRPSFSMARTKKRIAPGAMVLRIERAIRAIPRGKVSTYGGVAHAAGFPGAARMVARVLRRGFGLPWQRVLGAGGAVKLTGDSAIEQRLRLEAEGVRFRGRKVDMRACQWKPDSRRKVRGV